MCWKPRAFQEFGLDGKSHRKVLLLLESPPCLVVLHPSVPAAALVGDHRGKGGRSLTAVGLIRSCLESTGTTVGSGEQCL